MAGRASIVGAAATHVGKVREHNEDAHFIDAERGVFLVCDGMGGHAAGEVASALAIRSITQEWASDALHAVVERWLECGTADAKKQLLDVVRAGVLTAHDAILAEAARDDSKTGMGTTLVGAMIVGGELLFAQAGDSRAYLVRDGISMQLTEDHTLLARLLAAGIDVDVSGEGSRFRSMLTNALGIGDECKVATFLVPLADGDRFLLCSDGISEYVRENEVGDVLSRQPNPARAAQRLIDLALERGGGDNATAVVVRVLEAGETPLPAEQRRKDDAAISACTLWGRKMTPQQRLRALRIAIPRDHGSGDKLPPHALGDRVAWIIVEGELLQDGVALGPGALVYPESLAIAGEPAPLPDRDALAMTRTDVRALAIRADDFRELCDDDGEIGEALLESLGQMMAKRKPRRPSRDTASAPVIDALRATDPDLHAAAARAARGVPEARDTYETADPMLRAIDRQSQITGRGDGSAGESAHGGDNALRGSERTRATTVPDQPGAKSGRGPARGWATGESAIIAPAPPRAPVAQAPMRPSPPPPMSATSPPARPGPAPQGSKRTTTPLPVVARTSTSTNPPPPMSATSPPARPSPAPQGSKRTTTPGPVPVITSTGAAATSAAAPVAHVAALPHAPAAGPGASKPSSAAAMPRTPPGGTPRTPHPDATPAPGVRMTRRASTQPTPPPPLQGPRLRSRVDSPVPAAAAPRGFARPLSPPAGLPGSRSPMAPAVRAADSTGQTGPVTAATHSAHTAPATTEPGGRRLPSDPEIETYLEIEAELPPESGLDPELESELALNIVLSGLDDDGSVSIEIDDDDATVPTDIARSSPVLKKPAVAAAAAAPEPSAASEPRRPRTITAQNNAAVSGTISIPDDLPPAEPRRAKRHSEGGGD